MFWMLFRRETWLAVALMLSAGVASAQPPHPQAYYYPPPQPRPAYSGTFYPVYRPTAIGHWLFGPVWVYVPNQPQTQPQ